MKTTFLGEGLIAGDSETTGTGISAEHKIATPHAASVKKWVKKRTLVVMIKLVIFLGPFNGHAIGRSNEIDAVGVALLTF